MNRPNILLIMADQFRLKTLSGMGDGIHTPNINRIMEHGMVFTRASCTSPLCTPSRASFVTGQYPHRCGVQVHDACLPPDAVTYYQLLRKSGYRVGIVGKTDLHKQDMYCGARGDLPSMYQYGFTDPMEMEGKMNCAWYRVDDKGVKHLNGPYQHYLDEKDELEVLHNEYVWRLREQPDYYAAPSPLPEEDFQDTFIARSACDMLETLDDDVPWHLSVNFAGPHNPWDPPAKFVERWKNTVFPRGPKDDLEGKPEWIRKRAAMTADMTDEDEQNVWQHYAGAVSVIDDWVGQMLDILKRRGLDQNTIVVFCADHGEMLGEHRLLMKSVMYESSLRVPLVVYCPWMHQRKDCDALAELMDLAPTILELAGVTYCKEDMDAHSLLPLLRGEEAPLRQVQLSELVNTHMLFDGRYKWIRNFNDADELYDLQQDPHELCNCIAQNPEVVKRLQKLTFKQ